MKALILAGGKGTRLRPLTYTSAKQLVPVANKPVLIRVIETVRAAGITDVGIVVGDTAPDIKRVIGQGEQWDVKVDYIHQSAPSGLAHAVKESQAYLGDERFVMFLGDNVIQGGINRLIAEFAHSDWNAQVVLTRVAEPQHYGVAIVEDGHIERLIEKPRHPPSDLALVGIYMFDSHIFEAVHAIQPSWRGEYEITDAIQWMIDKGYQVHPYIHTGWWIDTGKTADMLAANALVLDETVPYIAGYVDRDSTVTGKVTIEKGAEIINSVIRGPAIIGEETRIVNSYVGPFTSIYHHCQVENSEIEHSIILENCEVRDLPARLEDSLIGRYVQIGRSPVKPKAYKMTLGDHSQVGVL